MWPLWDKSLSSLLSWGSSRSCHFCSENAEQHLSHPHSNSIHIPFSPYFLWEEHCKSDGDGSVFFVSALHWKFDLVQLKMFTHVPPKHKEINLSTGFLALSPYTLVLYSPTWPEIITGDTTIGLIPHQPQGPCWCDVYSESRRKCICVVICLYTPGICISLIFAISHTTAQTELGDWQGLQEATVHSVPLFAVSMTSWVVFQSSRVAHNPEQKRSFYSSPHIYISLI